MRQLRPFGAAIALAIASASITRAQVSTAAVPADSTQAALRALSLDGSDVSLNGRYVRGDTEVGAADTVRGPLVVLNGNAVVSGTVLGNVTAIFGDVTVKDGAHVLGGVTAWRGRVIIEGGRVRGALRASPSAAATAAEGPPLSATEALKLSAGWTAMLLIIGLVALVVAARNLDATARVLEKDFGRAFLVGVAGQLGFLPLLILTIVALAVTVVGALLIPFALVAAPVAFAGLITLGWLAIALMIGHALSRGAARDDRAAMIRAMVPGVLILMAPWFIAAALNGAGTGAMLARTVALGITWVAASAGLGAAMLSRAGTGRPPKSEPPPSTGGGWQTPTPVAGVATARRPVPARPGAPSQ